MSRTREYVGCKSIEAVNYDGNGNDLCNMWLTDEEIVRCRDCDMFHRNAESPFSKGRVWQDMCERTGFPADPNGFCKWGVRR